MPCTTFLILSPISHGHSTPIGYDLTVITAYATSDPFPDRLDTAFVETDGTGYFQVENRGSTTFTGQISDAAISVFAGDLSFASSVITLGPGQSASIAIGDNSADVGGFNGPAYFYRPGVEISITGSVMSGTLVEAIALAVSDSDIQSGVYLTDPYGLTSDSFVLQGGDPWGFANPTPYALALTDGTYTFTQPVPEPTGPVSMLVGVPALAICVYRRRRGPNARNT